MFEGQSFALKARGIKVDLDSLPKPDTVRWVARRKAEVVLAVSIGLLTTNEVCTRYNLSVEELNDWRRKFGHAGVNGLKVKSIR